MKYEMMFIIKPLEQDKINYAINRVVGFVKEIGVLTDVKRWGKRNLAYEIKGVKVGYYVIITFDSEMEKVVRLDRNMYNIYEVLCHMIIWQGGEIMGKDKPADD